MAILSAMALLLSALLTGLLRRALVGAGMLDRPGQRRLHTLPVARGGGLAIVLTVLVAGAWLAAHSPPLAGLLAGLLPVALAGWLDDRHGLGIGPRLALHLLSAAVVVATLLAWGPDWPATGLPLVVLVALALVAVVAAINLHNFIDGANGMLCWQALFVLSVVAVLTPDELGRLRPLALIVAAAVAGFLPFNFPRATVFLGDVGSGALGYLVAALGLWAWLLGAFSLPQLLLLNALVLIDGLATLAARVLAGKRWWRGHREHLYQWLVRSGRSHAQVSLGYLAVNLLLILPLLLTLRARLPRPATLGDATEWAALAGLVLAGVGAWVLAKRACLRRLRAQ